MLVCAVLTDASGASAHAWRDATGRDAGRVLVVHKKEHHLVRARMASGRVACALNVRGAYCIRHRSFSFAFCLFSALQPLFVVTFDMASAAGVAANRARAAGYAVAAALGAALGFAAATLAPSFRRRRVADDDDDDADAASRAPAV
jgi:hypothetical protein